MNKIQIKTTTHNIILIGFGENVFSIKEKMKGYFSEASFQNIDRLIDQSDWINQNENKNATEAIICDFDYMVKNDFMFIKNLHSNPSLIKIPIILINKNNMPIDVKELLSQGVDDCYSSPIDWKGMTARIQFLNKYKPFLMSKSDQWNETPFQ